jgi:hypothetical protein
MLFRSHRVIRLRGWQLDENISLSDRIVRSITQSNQNPFQGAKAFGSTDLEVDGYCFEAARNRFNNRLRGSLDIVSASTLYQIDEEKFHDAIEDDAIERNALPHENPLFLTRRDIETVLGIPGSTLSRMQDRLKNTGEKHPNPIGRQGPLTIRNERAVFAPYMGLTEKAKLTTSDVSKLLNDAVREQNSTGSIF